MKQKVQQQIIQNNIDNCYKLNHHIWLWTDELIYNFRMFVEGIVWCNKHLSGENFLPNDQTFRRWHHPKEQRHRNIYPTCKRKQWILSWILQQIDKRNLLTFNCACKSSIIIIFSSVWRADCLRPYLMLNVYFFKKCVKDLKSFNFKLTESFCKIEYFSKKFTPLH